MPQQRDQAVSKAVITATAAQLFVSDINASCDFFTQKLGFSIVFVYGEPPFFAQVSRDKGLLNLNASTIRSLTRSLGTGKACCRPIWQWIRLRRSNSSFLSFEARASRSLSR
jgi:hypothetical protein